MINVALNQKLIDLIKTDHISNLHLLSVLELSNHSNYTLEFLVDHIEKPNGIIIKENDYWHYIYALNESFLSTAKAYFDELDSYGVDACDKGVYDYMVRNRKIEWEEHCILHYHKDEIPMPTMALESIQITDLEMINDLYTYKDEESLEAIRENILERPSSIYRVNGLGVAWVMVHRDGSIGIMFVKDSYRNQGLAYQLTLDVLHKVKAENKIPFIHINVENKPSLALAKKCGFTKYKNIFWYGIKNN